MQTITQHFVEFVNNRMLLGRQRFVGNHNLMLRNRKLTPERLAKDGFADRLTQVRESAGYRTMTEFARAIGVSPATYSRWERGETEPGIVDMAKILSLAHASADFLVLGKVSQHHDMTAD